jgi:hypothetical protein
MSDAPRFRPRLPGRRIAALGLALSAHAVFVAALMWEAASGERGLPPLQPLEVRLVRLPPTEPRAGIRPPVSALSPRRAEATAALAPAPPLVLPAPPVSAPPKPEDTAPAPVAGALRAGLGCELSGAVDLTADERRHCQQRFVAGEAPGRTFAVVGRSQQAYFDASARRALWWREPFLATDPMNGCRPKVTNGQAAVPGGHASISDWRVSMGCAVSF